MVKNYNQDIQLIKNLYNSSCFIGQIFEFFQAGNSAYDNSNYFKLFHEPNRFMKCLRCLQGAIQS